MWWSYSDSAERKDRVRRKIDGLSKKGEAMRMVVAPKGKKLCSTFWGQAWCRAMEDHADYESRLPRGRSYLRQGNVYNLTIEEGEVAAMVAGSELYSTKVSIKRLEPEAWEEIVAASKGQVGSWMDLLAGKLGDGLMRLVTDPEDGLFPKPREIRFNCSCPDWADLCKHSAAVLYGVGLLLDEKPDLLFTLRGVNAGDLMATASEAAVADLANAGEGDLAGSDLSALFGIDLDPGAEVEAILDAMVAETAPEVAVKKVAKKVAVKKAVKKKVAKKKTRSGE